MNYSTLTWLSCCLLLAEGFTSAPKTAFVGQSFSSQSSTSRASSLRMDAEEPFSSKTILKRYNVPLAPLQTQIQIPKAAAAPVEADTDTDTDAVDQALEQHGLPWMYSIDPTYPADPEKGLFYMPFFEWQMQFMKDHLTNLRVIPTESQTGEDLSYVEKSDRPVRMVTLCFASDEYRKIRMTVYDAGNRTQVFTTLFYPHTDYNLPVLGVDLLQFNHDRHLCVCDFQPIHDTEADHAQPYEHLLKPIRDAYPSLQGRMTKRFFDETRFFSNQMLYSRFEELHNKAEQAAADATMDDHPAYRDLFPAFQQYVQTHLQLIQSTRPQPESASKVRQGQAAYDTYGADRDPAHGMFAKVFGQDFADAFVYDVLFSWSQGDQRE